MFNLHLQSQNAFQFRAPIRVGDLVELSARVEHSGKTSILKYSRSTGHYQPSTLHAMIRAGQDSTAQLSEYQAHV